MPVDEFNEKTTKVGLKNFLNKSFDEIHPHPS